MNLWSNCLEIQYVAVNKCRIGRGRRFGPDSLRPRSRALAWNFQTGAGTVEMKRPARAFLLALGALAMTLAMDPGARAQDAPQAGPKPLFSYTGAFNGVAAGGLSKTATYVHALA